MSQYIFHTTCTHQRKKVNFQAMGDVTEKYNLEKDWIPTWNPIQTDLPRLSLKKQGWEMEKYENTFRLK